MARRGENLKQLPRCGAKPKPRSLRTYPCKQAAMVNGRCYFHGGTSKIKHGNYSKASEVKRTEQRNIINQFRESTLALDNLVKGI